HFLRALGEPVVAAELDVGVLRQAQSVVAGARRIDHAPALLLAVAHLELGANLAIDEKDVAFAAEEIAELAAGILRQKAPLFVDRDVGEHENELVAEHLGVLRILDEERAVKAPADLRSRVDVRVIPEGAGVARFELVDELTARRNP